MKLEDLEIYQMSMGIGRKIWAIVNEWNYFEKDTLGKQIVRSSDSIAANIAESFGRYHYKDTKNFCFYARGSLYETKAWLIKAFDRSLIDQGTCLELNCQLEKLSVKLNNYIRTLGKENITSKSAANYNHNEYKQ